ncbi:MAG: hypothetical protein RLY16_880 [Bacteroidota bacterium]
MKDSIKKQAWIQNAYSDSLLILLPPFFCVAIVFLFPNTFQNSARGMQDAWWVILVLLIDVAHVYSTLYRTYFDPMARLQFRSKFVLVPFLAFVGSVLLYSAGSMLFWRVLAYIAVFHFIRQQYGFMRVYQRKQQQPKWERFVDACTIYGSTLFPILYWHFVGDRTFSWFVAGDFITIHAPRFILSFFSYVYVLLLVFYCLKEIRNFVLNRWLNIPAVTIVGGTAISWYIGIVYLNADMSFTLLNVVSHGIPYMALIWMYGKKRVQQGDRTGKLLPIAFAKWGWIVFLGIIFLLAFIEEGLWDIAVWKEHQAVFGWLPIHFQLPEIVYGLVVPLLVTPQLTHYLLDGFIWRVKKDDLKWSDNANH